MKLLYPVMVAAALVAAMFTYDAVRVGLWKRRVKAVTWAEVLQRIRENCPQEVVLGDGRRVCAIVLSDPRKPAGQTLPEPPGPEPAGEPQRR